MKPGVRRTRFEVTGGDIQKHLSIFLSEQQRATQEHNLPFTPTHNSFILLDLTGCLPWCQILGGGIEKEKNTDIELTVKKLNFVVARNIMITVSEKLIWNV